MSTTKPWSRAASLRLLRGVLGLVAVYAVAMIVVGDTVHGLFDELGFGSTDAGVRSGEQRDYVLFLQGVLGAVILGWVLLMLAVVRHGVERDPDGPWWGVLVASVVGWFVLDTGFSLVVGSWQHAVFNVGFLLALGAPLLCLRPGDRTSAGSGQGVGA